MKRQIKDYWVILFAAVAFLLCMQACKITPPVASSDSATTRIEVKDTVTIIQADSTSARYLIECEKTSEGYKARIIQLLTQKPGEYLQTPIATIDNNNVLNVSDMNPEREIHLKVYRFYFKSVKSQAFVRITNILTGWQWFQVYGFRIYAGLTLIAGIVLGIKLYLKSKVL